MRQAKARVTVPHLAPFQVLVHMRSNPYDTQRALTGQDLRGVEHQLLSAGYNSNVAQLSYGQGQAMVLATEFSIVEIEAPNRQHPAL